MDKQKILPIHQASEETESRLELPFVLSREREKEMFEDWCDEPYRVHLGLLYDPTEVIMPQDRIVGLISRLRDCQSSLPQTYVCKGGEPVDLSYGDPKVRPRPFSLWTKLTVKQRQWLHDGMYLQVGFSLESADSNFDPASCIAAAMTLYDADVSGSGSLLPKDHSPMVTGIAQKRDLILEVGRVFDEEYGVADWNESLIAVRNELLIKAGAFIRGLDPDSEFARFSAEGHQYFLDFKWPNK